MKIIRSKLKKGKMAMTQLPITVCFWNYDRTLPMVDGRITIEGCNAEFDIRRPEDAFHRAFTTAEYDVTEISFSRYMARYSEGEVAYDLIPVFPSRAFRHSALFIRTDRGINLPADLKGKTLGLMDFEMTAALVARGALFDDFEVAPQDIRWIVGAVEKHRQTYSTRRNHIHRTGHQNYGSTFRKNTQQHACCGRN